MPDQHGNRVVRALRKTEGNTQESENSNSAKAETLENKKEKVACCY